MEININVETKGIREYLKNVKYDLTDMQHQREEISRYMGREIQLRFNEEKDPEGKRWTPLSPIYLKWKIIHFPATVNNILQASKKLRKSFDFASGVSGGKLTIDITTTSKYFIKHQEGLKTVFLGKTIQLPKRRMVGINDKDKKNITNIIKAVWE